MPTPAESTAPAPAPLLRLLGTPLLWHAGRSTVLAPERPQQLLAFLAQQADWVSRERLAALFWPDHAADAARRNVRKVLFRAKALPDWPPLEEQAGSLRWPVATDVQRFEQLAGTDRPAALALWQGEPWLGLDGEGGPFADWVGFERHRLRSRWRDLLLAEIDAAASADAACRLARQLLEHDPLDEAALQALVQAQRGAAQAPAAEQSLREFADRLQQVHALAPGRWARALQAAGAPPEIDPGYIGRTAEAHELAALLAQPGCAWLTVTGPGGVGKSRFVQQQAPRAAQRPGWRCLTLPWDEVTDEAQALQSLADALHAEMAPGQAPWEAIAQALAAAPTLLVLDNLEQVPEAAQALAQATAGLPALQVLATSRVRLGVPGEWLLPLAGLPFPEPEDLEQAEGFDAVRLFVQQARLHQPRFDPAVERQAVVALCQLVEGLPLALELAAVWTRHLAVAQIVADLQAGRSELLQAAAPQAPARQQSLAATFDHSWRLLSPAERDGLARLSVFAGSFAREAVGPAAGVALPVLLALQDKSLVRDEAPGRPAGRGARWSLHPLVRQLAAERLAAQPGRQAEVADDHARHFLQLLARHPRGQWDRQAAYFDSLQHDWPNVRRAWQHGVDRGWRDPLAAGLVGLASYLHSRGASDEGEQLLAPAEPLLRPEPALRTELQCCRALLAFSGSQLARCAALAGEALRSARQRREPRQRRIALFLLGQSSLQMGELDTAARCFADALALAQAEGNGNGVAAGLATLAEIALLRGRAEEAVGLARRSIAQQERNGAWHVDTHAVLAQALRLAGQAQASAEAFARAHVLLGDRPGSERTDLLCQEAQAALAQGQLDRAEHLARQAEAAIADGGTPASRGVLALLQARVALRRGALAAARPGLQAALQEARLRCMRGLSLAVLVGWAEWLLGQQRRDEAGQLLAVALSANGLDAEEHALARQLAQRADAGPGSTAPAAGQASPLGLDQALAWVAAGAPAAGAAQSQPT